MHTSLAPYEKLVEEGYVNKNEKGHLVLYNYNDACTFARHWNEHTLAARGIIFNKETGECVARPFQKFFNLGENERTLARNLPDEPYHIFEKMDGSMGILYPYEEETYYIATRGSFASQQALTATEILKEKYPELHRPTQRPSLLLRHYTLLFEIIYPENRMCAGGRLVCDYGDMRDLVLLGAVVKSTREGKIAGDEMSRDDLVRLAMDLDIPVAPKHECTLEEVVAMQKTLPVEKEGFVVHYLNSNLRVKIKGDEYCKRQKILNGMTPLNIWAVLEKGVLPDTYKMELPEEILPEALAIEEELSKKYKALMSEVEGDFKKIPYTLDGTPEKRKQIALWLQANKLRHPKIMWSCLTGKNEAVDAWVKEEIRPKNNVL